MDTNIGHILFLFIISVTFNLYFLLSPYFSINIKYLIFVPFPNISSIVRSLIWIFQMEDGINVYFFAYFRFYNFRIKNMKMLKRFWRHQDLHALIMTSKTVTKYTLANRNAATLARYLVSCRSEIICLLLRFLFPPEKFSEARINVSLKCSSLRFSRLKKKKK